MLTFLVAFVPSFLIALSVAPVLIPRLSRAGIAGKDLHKPNQPRVAEMGGLAIVVGFSGGILVSSAAISFFHVFPEVEIAILLAGLSTILLTGLIGILDDLLGMHQGVKAALPVLAALPLMAVRAGQTSMTVPLLGRLDFWIFYPLVLLPAGVTVAANAVNMVAGFNGLEAGLGIVAMGSLAVIATLLKETTALVLLLSGLGALLGILRYNWYPAKMFVGDVGTLSIGAILAASCVVGNFETAGVILLIPYAIDFLLKARHGFPESFGELRDGKLHCPAGGPVGLGQLIMKVAGGIHERTLVLVLMGVEAVFGAIAIILYVVPG